MARFCTGEHSGIINRLRLDGREYREIVSLHINTVASCNEIPGWCPFPDEELFPVCPIVGDTFLMDGYYSDGDKESELEKKWWRVVSRSLSISAPSAIMMNGIVELFVEVADGPFPQIGGEEV